MKKVILIIAIAFFSVTFGFSQSQVYFGVSGLGLSSWVTNQNNYVFGMPDMDYTIRMGFGGSVNIGFDFNNHLGVKTEIGWASLGQKYKDTYGDTNNVHRTTNINYLQIPVLFKYRTGTENFNLYFAVGPQFNFLMNAKQTLTSDYPMLPDTITTISGKEFYYDKEDITERYQSMDIMARIDFGAEFHITQNLFLNAGLTFGYGLMDINADDLQIDDAEGNYKPSHNIYGGVQVGINYAIPLGKK